MHGTHTVRFEGARLEVETVESRRGVRPWTRSNRATPSAGARTEEGEVTAARAGRLPRFAAPHSLGRASEPLRPEIEDDDMPPGYDE